jgi:hypothetical protein
MLQWSNGNLSPSRFTDAEFYRLYFIVIMRFRGLSYLGGPDDGAPDPISQIGNSEDPHGSEDGGRQSYSTNLRP